MSSPDVCVIGAGPAGIAAAKAARKTGADVLLMERHLRPGGKACGGGLTPGAAARIPDAASYPTFRQLTVVSPFGRTLVTTPAPFMSVSARPPWIMAALEALTDLGVNVSLAERCRRIAPGVVWTDKRRLTTGLIVGADGPRSRVRRCLGLPSAVEIIARQVILAPGDVGFDALQDIAPAVYFNYARFGPGYGWVFPLENSVKVGLGVSVHTHDAATLKRVFGQWLTELGVVVATGQTQTGSIGTRYAGHRFDGVVLVGDAGGFADPVTGEGISQAFVSGQEVMKELLQPAYRSPELGRLITAHRRTLSLLFHPLAGRLCYDSAALLLRAGWLSRLAMSRFVRLGSGGNCGD